MGLEKMKILSGLLAFAVAQQAAEPVVDQDDQNAVDDAPAGVEEPSALEMAITDVDFGDYAGMEDLMVELFETVFDPEVMEELKKNGKDKPGKPSKGKGDKKKGDKPKKGKKPRRN